MKIKLLRFGLLSLLLGASLSHAANVYQVEMIVFSHLTTDGVGQEQWPLVDPPANPFQNALLLTSGDGYYQELPASDFILKHEQAEFNRNPEYRTWLHAAWRQPGMASNTPRIHVMGGPSYNANGTTEWSVNGTVHVTVSHYFNVAFNLFFAVPESTLARYSNNGYFRNSNKLIYFHLHETRRMKSRELNYIDSPLFGVLVKIVPVLAAK